jgi:uncharacterized protein YecT (DUF1311 family)
VRRLALVAALAVVACGPTQPAAPPAEPAADSKPAPPPREPPERPEVPIAPPGAAATDAEVEARYTPRYVQCQSSGQAADGVMTAIAACIADELRLQDGALNAEYQRIIALLPADRAQKLRETQRAWIVSRDRECAAEARTGGTIDRINGPACLLDETIRRTIALERMGVR